MHRRRLLGILTAALLSTTAVLAPAALAATPTGTAVQVGDVVTVGESSEGEATGAEVAGQQVSGTEGDGSDHLASTTDLGLDRDVVEVTVLATDVDGDESSADTVRVAVGGDDGIELAALSSERDADGATTTGVAVAGGGRSAALLHSAAEGTDGRTVVADLDGEEHGVNEQHDERLCTSELPMVIKAELFCAEGHEEGGAAAIVHDLSVEELSDATGLTVDVLRANGVGAPPPMITSDSPDPAESTPVVVAAPAPGTGITPAAPVPALGAPTPGPLGDLPNTGAPALAAALLGLGLVGTGSAMVRRRA